jgi:hypothetical protein
MTLPGETAQTRCAGTPAQVNPQKPQLGHPFDPVFDVLVQLL